MNGLSSESLLDEDFLLLGGSGGKCFAHGLSESVARIRSPNTYPSGSLNFGSSSGADDFFFEVNSDFIRFVIDFNFDEPVTF